MIVHHHEKVHYMPHFKKLKTGTRITL